MKKRIRVTQAFVDKVLRYKKKHFLMKYFCTKHLYKEDNFYHLVVKLWFPLYLLLYLPVMILKAFVCIWDGGLKTLSSETRVVIDRKVYKDPTGFYPDDYSICKEEWNRKVK